jgi:hypothetical protein
MFLRHLSLMNPVLGFLCVVQNVLGMLCRLWELVDADTWTLAFMEKNPNLFPWAHFPAVLARFQSLVHEAFAPQNIRQFLISADVHGAGLIPFRAFHVRPVVAEAP